jgi:hypothetical protein
MRITMSRTLLAIALVFGLGVVLNPSPERHRAKIKEAVASRSQLAALFALGDLAAFVSNYHSLGVASYTTAHQKLLSLGAFGFVVVFEP